MFFLRVVYRVIAMAGIYGAAHQFANSTNAIEINIFASAKSP